MASKIGNKDIVTLRSSAAIVSEFFDFAANSILYNRGLYPEESFAKVKKYGLSMLLIQDEVVKSSISVLTDRLTEWLEDGDVRRVGLVIENESTGEVLERWSFKMETDEDVLESGLSMEKSEEEITREIRAIMRQINTSVSYLPTLDDHCQFYLEARVAKGAKLPKGWVKRKPKLISNPETVKLHSFDTKVHKVGATVSYKSDVDQHLESVFFKFTLC